LLINLEAFKHNTVFKGKQKMFYAFWLFTRQQRSGGLRNTNFNWLQRASFWKVYCNHLCV